MKKRLFVLMTVLLFASSVCAMERDNNDGEDSDTARVVAAPAPARALVPAPAPGDALLRRIVHRLFGRFLTPQGLQTLANVIEAMGNADFEAAGFHYDG